MLVVTSLIVCAPLTSLNPFYDFVAMLCVITTAILYVILVFKLHLRILRCDCIFWPRVVSSHFIVMQRLCLGVLNLDICFYYAFLLISFLLIDS